MQASQETDEAGPERICEGDVILISGALQHGGHENEGMPRTLAEAARYVRDRGASLHCLRPLGTGGLARTLVDIAEQARISIDVDEHAIPVSPSTAEACERRHVDPLYLSSAGLFLVFVPHEDTERTLDALRSSHMSQDARIIGSVWAVDQTEVCLATRGGTTRALETEAGSPSRSS